MLHHYQYYFDNTGVTFKETNGEYTETAHQTLRKEEGQRGMGIVRKVATPIHHYRSLKVLTIFNSTKIGGNIEGTFRKKYKTSSSRSSTPSPSSSPYSTGVVAPRRSPFDQNCTKCYPAGIAAHFTSNLNK